MTTSASSRSARISLASCLLLAVAAFQNLACVPIAELMLGGGDADFNERIRPDLQPLTPLQTSGPPWVEIDGKAYHSDGGPDGDQLVSELHHSMIPPERLRELRRSRCLFVEGGGFPVLTYEATLTNYDLGGREANLDTVSLCGGYAAHPETRTLLEVEGLGSGFAVQLDTLAVGLFSYSGNELVRNPYGACDEQLPSETSSFTQGRDLAGGSPGTFKPVCLLQGAPAADPIEDTSYVLEYVDAHTGDPISLSYPQFSSPVHQVIPHLKVVRGSRTIARPLSFAGVELDVERNRYVHTFAWAVESVDPEGNPDPSGAFWRENFGPSVLVESAAFFVQIGSGPAPEGSPLRDYVIADKLRIAEVGDLGPQEPFPVDMGCDLEQAGDPDGDGSLYLSPCDIVATPTYALSPDVNGRMTEKLEWRVQFFTENANDPVPVDPSEPFFIEFTLQAPQFGSQAGSLRIDPGYADAGDAPIGTTQRVESALRLESDGAAGVLVEDIRVIGRDAGAFDVELPFGSELPFVLPSGSGVALDLLVETSTWGPHQAQLAVSWSDAGQQQVELYATLLANGVQADLEVLPRVVSLKRGDAANGPNDHVRNVLVTNFGNAPLQRGRLGVSGYEASYFRVVRSECDGKVTQPPSAHCNLQPGGMELLTVEYHPLLPGLHEAVLRLETDAGSDEVILLGHCEGVCSYLPPQPEGGPGPGPGSPSLEAAIDVTVQTGSYNPWSGVLTPSGGFGVEIPKLDPAERDRDPEPAPDDSRDSK